MGDENGLILTLAVSRQATQMPPLFATLKAVQPPLTQKQYNF